MSKRKKLSEETFYCPNPNCTSNRFKTVKQLNMHIGQKYDCSGYLSQLRKSLSASVAQTMLSPSENNTPTVLQEDHQETVEGSPAANELPQDFDNREPTEDEHFNFDVHQEDDEDENFVTHGEGSPYTNAHRVEIILLKILIEIEAPLWAFEDLMDWACDAYQTGYNFMPRQKQYKAQVENITKWLGMEHMQPQEVTVTLPGKIPGQTIKVTTFDFISQFHSLLSDPELQQLSNLTVNPDNPFSKYRPPDGLLGECLSGSWYQSAWEHMENAELGDFMIPIILYIDKTLMSKSEKLSIFPVQMSLGIFTEVARRSSRAWRPLGYIANEDYYFSTAERKINSADVKNERFHRQLEAIFASFKKAQAKGALSNTPLQLGTHSKVVNLYIPLQFIIGDVEGGDQLSGRLSYHGMLPRLCWTCDVSTEDSNRTHIQCSRIRLADMKALVDSQDRAALKSLSQRPGFNALYTIDCGNDPYGVFSMIHTEGLHALEVGLIPYMLEILMTELKPKHHVGLDNLVKSFLDEPRQHGYKNFPRFLWQDGVTKLTLLTGDQKVGKMFAICVAASTLEGEQFFSKHLPGKATTWRKMLYVFQQILCYWAWLKQDTYWMAGDTAACETATHSIRIMMQQLQALWPRKKGLEWNLTKLHEQFHVPMDILRHGRHKNVHTGPQEHNHIPIKHAARRTQKNRKKLDYQTGRRIMERLVIQRAFDQIVSDDPSRKTCAAVSKQHNPTRNASKGKFRFQKTMDHGNWEASGCCIWEKEKNQNLCLLLQDEILAYLGSELFLKHATPDNPNNPNGNSYLDIPFYTEYERNGYVYRAHPKYRGEYPYYDWAKIKWWDGNVANMEEEQFVSIIGKIMVFFLHPTDGYMAIVHSCQWGTNEVHGVFGTYWHLETAGSRDIPRPKFSIVSVDCIEDHAFMVPYSRKNPYTWVHISDKADWPSCFQTILPPDDNNVHIHRN